MITHIDVKQFECAKCGYRWIPRNIKVSLECPKCKSRDWNGSSNKIKMEGIKDG